jgi:hypothetical protein
VTDPCEPQSLQLLHLTYTEYNTAGSEDHVCDLEMTLLGLGTDVCDLQLCHLKENCRVSLVFGGLLAE